MDNNTRNVAQNAGQDVQNNDHANVVPDVIETPAAIVDSNRQPPTLPAEPPHEFVDMLMTFEEYDDLPALAEVSDTDSDWERDAREVVMQTVVDDDQDQHPPLRQRQSNVPSASSSRFRIPILNPTPPSSTPQRNNRRARVEDDDDEERDRRHPSQRISSLNSPAQASTSNATPNPFIPYLSASFRGPSSSTNAGIGFPGNLFMPIPNPAENTNTPNVNSNDNATNSTPPQSQGQQQQQSTNGGADNRRAPIQFIDYEFSIVLDGSRPPRPTQQGPPAQQQAPVPDGPNNGEQPNPTQPAGTPGAPNLAFNPPIPLGNLATLLGIPLAMTGAFGSLQDDKDDPERARKLVDGLERVPIGLVRRLERVGTGGGGMGEDTTRGGDVGCAICWDRLIPNKEHEGESAEKNEVTMNVDGEHVKEEPDSKYPMVVTLPCAHVFHAECLIPWFSRPRHTTCPTCRFNIDPENLTYVSARRRRQERETARRQREQNNDNQEAPAGEAGNGVPPPLAPAAGAPNTNTNTAEQPHPQQQQQNGLLFDVGGGFAGMLQMLNAQSQQPGVNAGRDAANVGQPQVPTPMPMPTPTGITGHPFPPGMLPIPMMAMSMPMSMPMPMPMPVPGGTTEGPVPMTMPLRFVVDEPNFVGTPGGMNRTNAAGGAPANDADVPPLAPADAASDNASDNFPPQPEPPQPPMMADILRISIDMVINGRPRRERSRPQSAPGDAPLQDVENTPQRQATDNGNGMPEAEGQAPRLMTLEEIEAEQRRLDDFIGLLTRNRPSRAGGTQNDSNNNNAAGNPPTESDDSDQPTPHHHHDDPPQPRNQVPAPNLPPPLGFAMPGFQIASASGSGRSFEEALDHVFANFERHMATPGAAAPAGPANQNPQPQQLPANSNAAADGPAPSQQPQQADNETRPRPPWQFIPIPLPGFPMRPQQPEGPKRPWAPPPAPGPTLRQRIERREREAGLRCHDVSCGLGPSDEDPLRDEFSDSLREVQQLSILSKVKDVEGLKDPVCEHMFHSPCLVSAERVAHRGAEVVPDVDGSVEVSCPVCRGVGCVTQEQWVEGVTALQ